MGASMLVVIVVIILAGTAAASSIYVCDPTKYKDLGLDIRNLAFCNSSLSYEDRAKDLVYRLTLPEKVGQLGNTATGISRLGIPKYEWWSEALHGVSNTGPGVKFVEGIVGGATSFPQVILSAASFNETLWKTMGQVVSTEARAMHNVGLAGLTYWSPNINVLRDPRWGRAQETPGEDPYVVGQYASAYVRGLQETANSSSDQLKVAACCKHYTAYDVDKWKTIDRLHFDAQVTEQDMKDTFQPPFQTCVTEGGVSSVMCSYNRINGVPSCADPKLLNETIRGQWGLNGYIVSDCDSVEVLFDDISYTKTPEDAVAYVLRSGLDLDCGSFYPKYLESAVLKGKVAEREIDGALIKLYIVLMRLGFFETNSDYASLGPKNVCTAENRELAVEAARQGIVLLQNDGTLPLNHRHIKTLAVIGPNANATSTMIGNYAGIPCEYTSPLQGLSKYAKTIYEAACADVGCNRSSLQIRPAMKAAEIADATVLVMGLDLSWEAESLDREDLLLPGSQMELVTMVAQASKGPVILVIMSAGGIDVTFAQKVKNIAGILWVGYPGEGGGDAIAQRGGEAMTVDCIAGGRLPMTWYPQQYVETVNMTDMHMRADRLTGFPGRTYRFYGGDLVYPFGYGLSYTVFNYSLGYEVPGALNLKLGKGDHCHSMFRAVDGMVSECPSIRVEETRCEGLYAKLVIQVANTGKRDGSDVVMVYAKPPIGLNGAPYKHLIAFRRVFVRAGEKISVAFDIDVCRSFTIVDGAAYQILPAGEHSLVVGDGSQISVPIFLSLSPYKFT
eukprot:Gb_10188 [translate_table: standard]